MPRAGHLRVPLSKPVASAQPCRLCHVINSRCRRPTRLGARIQLKSLSESPLLLSSSTARSPPSDHRASWGSPSSRVCPKSASSCKSCQRRPRLPICQTQNTGSYTSQEVVRPSLPDDVGRESATVRREAEGRGTGTGWIRRQGWAGVVLGAAGRPARPAQGGQLSIVDMLTPLSTSSCPRRQC